MVNGLKVEINGQATLNSSPLTQTPVFLSYSVTGGNEWTSLTLVNTDQGGYYSAVWTPDVTGNYQIKATTQASSDMNAGEKIINLVVTPDTEHNVFTLTSNSTITQFSFSPETQELSFTASGPSGSHGYVNIYIPKTILSDISTLKAYIDGNEVNFTSQSQTDYWLISFSYSHSTHTIKMSFGNQTLLPDSGFPSSLVVITAITVVVVAVVAVFGFKRKTPPSPN